MRIVHPFATEQFRMPADPGNKADDTDLRGIHRAAVNGFALYHRKLLRGPHGLPGRPLNAAERRRWRAVRKKMGRPRIGRGVKRVVISIEAGLLEE